MSTIDPLECFVGVPTAQVCSYHDENDKRSSKIGGQPVSERRMMNEDILSCCVSLILSPILSS